LFYADNQFVLFNDNLEQLKSITKMEDDKLMIDEFLADEFLKTK
jgi:hypothetical protein